MPLVVGVSRSWQRCLLVILTVAASAGLGRGASSLLGTCVPYVTFFPAVAVSAIFSGSRGGLLATVLSVGSLMFWGASGGALATIGAMDRLGMAVFIISGSVICLVTMALESEQRSGRPKPDR